MKATGFINMLALVEITFFYNKLPRAVQQTSSVSIDNVLIREPSVRLNSLSILGDCERYHF